MLQLPLTAPETRIDVQEDDFDLGVETARLCAGDLQTGGIACFVGRVRGSEPLRLEHYPGMTERQLAAIAAEACRRWDLRGLRIIHRVGTLPPGAQIVLVLVAAAHRAEAFDACSFLMDWLKTKAPFWKFQCDSSVAGGGRWVEAKDSDDDRAARWG